MRFDCVWMQTQKSPNDHHIRIQGIIRVPVVRSNRIWEVSRNQKIIYAHVSFVNLTPIWTPFKTKKGYQFSLKSENIEILPILSTANLKMAAIRSRYFLVGIFYQPYLNIYAKSCGNPFGSFRYKWGQRFWHMFRIIIRRNGAKTISLQTSFEDLIIIIRNGAKKISLQTSFGDLIRNRANTICLLKLRLGDIIRNGANTIRYDIIWLPNDGYQFATS